MDNSGAVGSLGTEGGRIGGRLTTFAAQGILFEILTWLLLAKAGLGAFGDGTSKSVAVIGGDDYEATTLSTLRLSQRRTGVAGFVGLVEVLTGAAILGLLGRLAASNDGRSGDHQKDRSSQTPTGPTGEVGSLTNSLPSMHLGLRSVERYSFKRSALKRALGSVMG